MNLTLATTPPTAAATMETTSNDRLEELLQGLTDCSADDASWSIAAARDESVGDEDPLATVARAMVLLRRRGPC